MSRKSMIQATLDAQAPPKEDGFYTAVSKLIDDGWGIEDAVETLLERPEYRESIISAASRSIKGYVRTQTRQREQVALSELAQGNYAAAKQELVKASFALPTGETVGWMKATPEQHRMRATWMRDKAKSHVKTAHVHETIAQVLNEAGVKNLGQIKAIHKFPELQKVMKEIK